MLSETNVLIFDLLYKYSYFVLFPLVVVEGPVVTLIAGFLASSKFLYFLPAYIAVIFGDVAGDALFYLVGNKWFDKFVHGFFGFLKRDVSKIEKFKKILRNHSGKVLFFGKLSHAIGAPILVAAGLAKVPFKEFLWFNFLATIPKSLIIMLVGYYFGSALTNFDGYLRYTLIGLIFLTAIMILVYIVIVKAANNIMKRFEK